MPRFVPARPFASACYHSGVVKRRVFQLLVGVAAASLCVAYAAARRDSTFTPLSHPQSTVRTAATDPTVVRLLSQATRSTHVLRAIAVDIDRDGDLDVVATTSEDVLAIWVNQGEGRFTRERPNASPVMSTSPTVAGAAAREDTQAVVPKTTRWQAGLAAWPVRFTDTRALAHVPGASSALVHSWLGFARQGRAPPFRSLLA